MEEMKKSVGFFRHWRREGGILTACETNKLVNHIDFRKYFTFGKNYRSGARASVNEDEASIEFFYFTNNMLHIAPTLTVRISKI